MRIIFPLLFMLIFLGFVVWANIYLSRRFAYYFDVENLRILYIFFASTTIFMIGGLAGFTNSVSESGTVLYKVAAIVMGFVLYLLIIVLLTDLVSLFVKIKPGLHGILTLTLTTLISVYGIINAYNTRIKKVEIGLKGLQHETSIMHLTDIHIGHFRGLKFLKRLATLTNSENPDIVVITGDLFDGKVRLKQEILDPLKTINTDIFFVDGNHDGYTGVQRVKKIVANAGIRVLENEVLSVKGLQLAGLNHMLPDRTSAGMHTAQNGNTMKDILPTLEIAEDLPSILLHHSPDGIEYASKAGIDLYLSGHTHAGQLFPVTLLNDLIFKYNRGLHSYNGLKIFVSAGAGTFGPPMRIGTRSEIVFIKLKPE